MLSRELVQPREPVERITRCTRYDSMLKYSKPRIALSYRGRLDVERLRRAYAQVLCDFSVYSGRLLTHDGGLYIRHGAGSGFEVAESSLTSAELGAAGVKRPSLVCPAFSMRDALRGTGPVFSVRTTQTRDGSVVAVAENHAVGDLTSAVLLIRAWSRAYRGEPYEQPLEVLDREAYLNLHLPVSESSESHFKVVSWVEALQAARYWTRELATASRVRLDFSWQDIAAIQAAAARGESISSNDALVAHVLLTIRRLRETRASSLVALGIDFRGRYNLPLNLLGNGVDAALATAQPGDDTAAIATRLRRSLEQFPTGPVTHRDLAQFAAERPGLLERARFWHETSNPERNPLLISNYAKAKLGDLAFDASRPVYVDIGTSDTSLGANMILERPDGAGLTVDVWQPKAVVTRMLREHAESPLSVLRKNDDWSRARASSRNAPRDAGALSEPT